MSIFEAGKFGMAALAYAKRCLRQQPSAVRHHAAPGCMRTAGILFVFFKECSRSLQENPARLGSFSKIIYGFNGNDPLPCF